MGLLYANDVVKSESADEHRLSLGVVTRFEAFLSILSGILCAEKLSGYSRNFVVVLCADKESEA